jgi:hypothetical protein
MVGNIFFRVLRARKAKGWGRFENKGKGTGKLAVLDRGDEGRDGNLF